MVWGLIREVSWSMVKEFCGPKMDPSSMRIRDKKAVVSTGDVNRRLSCLKILSDKLGRLTDPF